MLLTQPWIRCLAHGQVHAVPRVKRSALASEQLDADYYKCWSGLRSRFTASALREVDGPADKPGPAPRSNGSL